MTFICAVGTDKLRAVVNAVMKLGVLKNAGNV